jgi:hypothetical protein
MGAGPPSGVDQVTLFVPRVVRDGRPIDQAYGTEQALATFGRLFRGATAFPPGRGVWRDDERGGELVYDETQMVTSYVSSGAFDDDEVVKRLKEFLCRMGRDANQGEIGIVIDGTYFGIVDYEEGGSA